MLYGGSQASGRIRGAAADLHDSHSHSNSDLSCICDPHHSSQQCQFNPVSKAKDQTCNLMDTSQILFPLSHDGNANYF